MPRMVGTHTRLDKGSEEEVVPQVGMVAGDLLEDLSPLLLPPRPDAVKSLGGKVTVLSAGEKDDGGKELRLLQDLDHLYRMKSAQTSGGKGADQLRPQGQNSPAGDEPVPEGDRSLGGGYQMRALRADPSHPGSDLSGIGDGGREQEQLALRRGEDYHLFPGGPPLLIPEVVGLIEDDEGKGFSSLVEGVPQDFGCGHNEGSRGVLPTLPCEEAHALVTKKISEVVVLLIGEGLKGSGIPAPFPPLEKRLNGPFGDPSLSTPRGGRYYHIPPFSEGIQGLLLKGGGDENPFLRFPHAGEELKG